METTHKPTFKQAVDYLVGLHGSLNKAARAVGLSPSGLKYQASAPSRKRSNHTRDWLCQQALQSGWKPEAQ